MILFPPLLVCLFILDFRERTPSTSTASTRSSSRTVSTLLISPQKLHPTTTSTAKTMAAAATHTGTEIDETQAVLECNQRLLTAIVNGDYATYDKLCSDDMTCIEPESNKQVVVGKAFHKYYFDLFGSPSTPVLVSMVRPLVQFMGSGNGNTKNNVAVVTYIRLNQIVKTDGTSETTQTSETRVWEKNEDGKWRNRHFHKS